MPEITEVYVNGELVSNKCYGNNEFEFNFTKEYLDKLKPGSYQEEVVYDNTEEVISLIVLEEKDIQVTEPPRRTTIPTGVPILVEKKRWAKVLFDDEETPDKGGYWR